MRRMGIPPCSGSGGGLSKTNWLSEPEASQTKRLIRWGKKTAGCAGGRGTLGATATSTPYLWQPTLNVPVPRIGQCFPIPQQQAGCLIERPVSRQADAGSADQNTATISINNAPFLLICTMFTSIAAAWPIPPASLSDMVSIVNFPVFPFLNFFSKTQTDNYSLVLQEKCD